MMFELMCGAVAIGASLWGMHCVKFSSVILLCAVAFGALYLMGV